MHPKNGGRQELPRLPVAVNSAGVNIRRRRSHSRRLLPASSCLKESLPMTIGSVPLAVVLAFSLSAAGRAGDWPQFRGPNRDDLSTETGLLKSWPKEGPPLLWKATGVGGGYSSISVAGDRIYTLGNKGRESF